MQSETSPATLPASEPIAEAEVRAACELILASPGFAKAHRMRRLLIFLVEQAIAGNIRATTEYAIALEVFDRSPSDYSPGEDPTVRVQMGRLRQRLDAYAALHHERGSPDSVLIRIPLGSYMPVITRGLANPLQPPSPAAASALAIQPVRCLANDAAGEAFARGLQEELVSRLVASFGSLRVIEAAPAQAIAVPRVVVSSLRIDPCRLRASIRLLEAPHNQVTWARQFDREPRFTIDEQEQLAESICAALREHLSA